MTWYLLNDIIIKKGKVFTAESAFLFRDRSVTVPRRSKSSNVLKRPQPSLRILRTNNAIGRLRTL